NRLLSVMSDGLRNLLTALPANVRIWWSSTTPELDDFPWELTADPGKMSVGHRLVFVRGLPPVTPIPAVPIYDSPKMAVIGSPALQPAWWHSIQDGLKSDIISIDSPLREALKQAVASGCELVHVFSDGLVSSALE